MKVAQILGSKGHTVVTSPTTASIAEVAKALSTQGIGVVVATDDQGAIAGIVSERDIVRGLADSGAGLLAMSVAELMTRAVVTCDLEASVDDVMELMTANGIRHLPVVRDDFLVGVISIVDVVRALLAREELNREVRRASG